MERKPVTQQPDSGKRCDDGTRGGAQGTDQKWRASAAGGSAGADYDPRWLPASVSGAIPKQSNRSGKQKRNRKKNKNKQAPPQEAKSDSAEKNGACSRDRSASPVTSAGKPGSRSDAGSLCVVVKQSHQASPSSDAAAAKGKKKPPTKNAEQDDDFGTTLLRRVEHDIVMLRMHMHPAILRHKDNGQVIQMAKKAEAMMKALGRVTSVREDYMARRLRCLLALASMHDELTDILATAFVTFCFRHMALMD